MNRGRDTRPPAMEIAPPQIAAAGALRECAHALKAAEIIIEAAHPDAAYEREQLRETARTLEDWAQRERPMAIETIIGIYKGARLYLRMWADRHGHAASAAVIAALQLLGSTHEHVRWGVPGAPMQ